MEIKLCTPERINGINATVDRASLEALSSLALVLLGLGGCLVPPLPSPHLSQGVWSLLSEARPEHGSLTCHPRVSAPSLWEFLFALWFQLSLPGRLLQRQCRLSRLPWTPLCMHSPAANFHLDVRLSLPIGPVEHLLPIYFEPGQPPSSRRWCHPFFPSHLRWDLQSTWLLPSSPPHPPVSRHLVLLCRRWAPVSFPIPFLLPPWGRSPTPDAEIMRRLSQPIFLPKLLSHLFHPTHHCQMNRAKILL